MTESNPTDQLWCVHVPSSDELYPAANLEAAEKHAADLNEAFRRYFEDNPPTKRDPGEISLLAVVVPWDGDRDTHAEVLRRFTEGECLGHA
jgi:hypothetical protein